MCGDLTTIEGCTDILMVLRQCIMMENIVLVSKNLRNKTEKWAGWSGPGS